MSLLIKETQQVAYFSVFFCPLARPCRDERSQGDQKKLDFWPQTLNTVLLLPLHSLYKKRDTTKLTTRALHPALNSLNSLCHIFST